MYIKNYRHDRLSRACAHTVGETTTKFCIVIKLNVRKICARLTTNAGAPATRDLFAVANLLV